MESGHASAADRSKAFDGDAGVGRTAPGLVDEIGERTLILGDERTPTLELLRFRQTLTTSPGFEVALRRRVERLRHFRHPAFAPTPAVECLGPDRSLALLSDHTAGRRLSEVLAHAQDPLLAASLIHQLTPALDALNAFGEGVGHGALTASRIVITPDGTLIIVEHVLGSAVERLHLTGAALRRDLGIPVPGRGEESLRADGPSDCFQLALIALSMLLGRRLIADDYADLAGTLHAALPASDRECIEPVSGLRVWLGRALQLEHGFASSSEAKAALRELQVPDSVDSARRWRALRETPDHAGDGLLLSEFPEESSFERTRDVRPAVEVAVEPVAMPVAGPSRSEALPPTFVDGTKGYLRWALVAVALCAILEAVVIATLVARRGSISPSPVVAHISLMTNDPGAPVKVDGRLAGVTPLDLSINTDVRSITVGSSLSPAPKREMAVGSTGQDASSREIGGEPIAARSRPVIGPAAPQRSGGIRVSSPIELEVFEGDRRLGSTATGIVSAPAGRYEVDLINSVLGFRSRQVVDVRAGQVVGLTVSPPNGRININAIPWAEVLIDGKSVGETPIGNLSIPLGEHQIVFRHPQLGETRQTAIVRSDAVTRVSANLER
jgi:hypothetical protein